MLKKCLQCGNEFNAHANVIKYCSITCSNNARKKGKWLNCKICGKKFWATVTRLKLNAQYCSTKCGCQIAKRKGKYMNCVVCGKEIYSRTRDIPKKKFCSNICRHKFVRQENHHNWINGKSHNGNGYIVISSPSHPKQRGGYVLEHRVVMEKHLGRYLKSKELVHHINGIKTDNHLDNLMLFPSNKAHLQYHAYLRKLN